MFGCRTLMAIWAFCISLATVVSSVEPVSAQTKYTCEALAAKEAVSCNRGGMQSSPLEYPVPGLAAVLARSKAAKLVLASASARETAREEAEKFREFQLEGFRKSLEGKGGLRLRAEDERKAGDQALYDALLDMYWQLMERYHEALWSYQELIQSIYQIPPV